MTTSCYLLSFCTKISNDRFGFKLFYRATMEKKEKKKPFYFVN